MELVSEKKSSITHVCIIRTRSSGRGISQSGFHSSYRSSTLSLSLVPSIRRCMQQRAASTAKVGSVPLLTYWPRAIDYRLGLAPALLRRSALISKATVHCGLDTWTLPSSLSSVAAIYTVCTRRSSAAGIYIYMIVYTERLPFVGALTPSSRHRRRLCRRVEREREMRRCCSRMDR